MYSQINYQNPFMKKIKKPNAGEYLAFYDTYINLSPDDDKPLKHLKKNMKSTIAFFKSLPKDKLTYRYSLGKWTIKEVLVHLMDAERIFAYRALRFSRKDSTELAGFDENTYAPNSGANDRSLKDILKEYTLLRKSTIAFFEGLEKEAYQRTGSANGGKMIVSALPHILVGHEQHHLNVICERYL